MKSITLLDMLGTRSYKNILKLKLDLIKFKKVGWIFYKETMSELPMDKPFEIYFHATKGTITYQNAFPIPARYYKPWMRRKANLQQLLPYFHSYYENDLSTNCDFLQSLSCFRGEKFVWVYKEG